MDRGDEAETQAQRIRRLRQERGWSLDEMVRRTGMAKGTLVGAESDGRREFLKPSTLEAIARAFGVSAVYLQTGLNTESGRDSSWADMPTEVYARSIGIRRPELQRYFAEFVEMLKHEEERLDQQESHTD